MKIGRDILSGKTVMWKREWKLKLKGYEMTNHKRACL